MISLGITWIVGALLSGSLDAVPLPTDPGDSTADLRIGLPGKSWSVWIHPADFEFGPPMPGPTAETVWASGDAIEPGLSMTVLLRSRPGARHAEDCLEMMSPRAGIGSCGDRGVDCSEHAGMATFEYRIERQAALPFEQGHLRAYLYHDGVCGEIHLTKTDYRRRERKSFLEVLESIERVDEATRPTAESPLTPPHSD